MTLTALLNLPVTIIHRSSSGDLDEFGGELTGETLTETVGELQQVKRAEPNDQGEISDSSWLLVLPAGTEIDTSDGVIADGQVFEVVGAPWRVRNPRTGLRSHVEASLRRVATAEDAS